MSEFSILKVKHIIVIRVSFLCHTSVHLNVSFSIFYYNYMSVNIYFVATILLPTFRLNIWLKYITLLIINLLLLI